MVINERSDATNSDGFIHGTKRTTSCVRITSATTTRVARTQKSLGSKSSRFDRCTTEATVMDEGPKSGRPGRPGEELVRGASSLTTRSSCTEAEAGLGFRRALGRSLFKLQLGKVFSRGVPLIPLPHFTLSTAQTNLELRGIGPSGNRMRRSRPLAEAHPELLVIDTPGLSREYRIENWHPSRTRHGRVIDGLPWISWVDVFSMLLVGLLWPSVRSLLCLSSLGDSQRQIGAGEYSPNDWNGNRARPA